MSNKKTKKWHAQSVKQKTYKDSPYKKERHAQTASTPLYKDPPHPLIQHIILEKRVEERPHFVLE
jgi:hypothetical protein